MSLSIDRSPLEQRNAIALMIWFIANCNYSDNYPMDHVM